MPTRRPASRWSWRATWSPAKKPAPDIYQLALERLGVEPAEALVIEDSRNGMLAAVGAGLACVVTVSSYTGDEDFSEAVLVVSSLGDPEGERTEVLASRGVREPGDFVVARGPAVVPDRSSVHRS